MIAMKTGPAAETEGALIASSLVPTTKIRGDDAADTRLLRKMSEEAGRYISSFSWCSSVVDSYFAGGVGGIFAVFFFHIQPSRRRISPWIWIIVGDIPPAYLPLDDCSSPAEAFRTYLRGMSKWVEFARAGKTGTPEQGVPPVDAPATPEWAERLNQRLYGLTIAIQEIFQDEDEKALLSVASGASNERDSARILAALGGIAPQFPEIPRRKASTGKPHGKVLPH
jgi:hypothetical protein